MEYQLNKNEKTWLLILLFIISILVSWMSYPMLKPSWSAKAVKEAEAAATINCSGRGRAYLDGIVVDVAPMCECNTCYNSPHCSTLLPNYFADVVSGKALFLEKYWMQYKSNAAVLISAWHRMSYYFVSASGNTIIVELEKHIKLLHEVVGNAKSDEKYIIFGNEVFLFANSKCKRYFHNRLNPAKLSWTAMYRKQRKKDIHAEAIRKKRSTTKKPYARSIVGATLEVIQKKRAEKPEVGDAAREAALREIKQRIKKTKDEKKAKKAELTAKSQKTQGKGSMPKGGKGPKLGGGGGKG